MTLQKKYWTPKKQVLLAGVVIFSMMFYKAQSHFIDMLFEVLSSLYSYNKFPDISSIVGVFLYGWGVYISWFLIQREKWAYNTMIMLIGLIFLLDFSDGVYSLITSVINPHSGYSLNSIQYGHNPLNIYSSLMRWVPSSFSIILVVMGVVLYIHSNLFDRE